MNIGGYHQSYALINLTNHSVVKKTLSKDVIRRWIGGTGLGSSILINETPAGYHPFSEESLFVVSFSPLVGSPLTTSAKFAIVAKSPLTQRLCDAMCSSGFAINGKKLGVDAFAISGKLTEWSVLFLESTDTGHISLSLRSAEFCLGDSARKTEDAIRLNFGEDWSVLSIGPAGEQQIPYATVTHDGRHAGRGGLGAILGSKRIKAIAVRGDIRTFLSDTETTLRIARDLSEKSLGPATSKYRELGTVGNLLLFNRFGALPARNFQSGHIAEAEKLVPVDLAPAEKLARNSCRACTIGCEHIYSVGKSADKGTRMEYESLFALGPLCGINDPETVMQAAALCDEYGIDTISTGGTIAFLMDCSEKGLISGQVDGTEEILGFGKESAYLNLIRNLIKPQSGVLTDLLRLGSRTASQQIGKGSETFAPHVKGMEMPGYHPNRLHAMALGLAVGTRGADHNRSGAYEIDFREHDNHPESIAKEVCETENRAALMDSVILCKFIRGVLVDYYGQLAEMLNAVTGFDYTFDELVQAANRIVQIRKAFNQREGWNMKEDWLPDFCFQQMSETSHECLTREKVSQMIRAYYACRGWDTDGRLTDHNIIALMNP